MKPIIIFTQKDENGNICMSAEKFEKYIQMAYESGVEEGKSKSSITTMRALRAHLKMRVRRQCPRRHLRTIQRVINPRWWIKC